MKKTVLLNILVAVAATVVLSACGGRSEFLPKEGDILFQVGGESDFSSAITDATAWEEAVKYDHVAMVAVDENGPYVLEASAKYGVVRTEWEDFVASSALVNGKPGLVVMRLNVDFPADEAVRRAEGFIGQEYDWSYYPDNGMMYCSELIYESYFSADGERLFSAQPMNFLDAEGNMPVFWTELFEKLGKPVPQGIPGTNPNDMSRDPKLEMVYCFF